MTTSISFGNFATGKRILAVIKNVLPTNSITIVCIVSLLSILGSISYSLLFYLVSKLLSGIDQIAIEVPYLNYSFIIDGVLLFLALLISAICRALFEFILGVYLIRCKLRIENLLSSSALKSFQSSETSLHTTYEDLVYRTIDAPLTVTNAWYTLLLFLSELIIIAVFLTMLAFQLPWLVLSTLCVALPGLTLFGLVIGRISDRVITLRERVIRHRYQLISATYVMRDVFDLLNLIQLNGKRLDRFYKLQEFIFRWNNYLKTFPKPILENGAVIILILAIGLSLSVFHLTFAELAVILASLMFMFYRVLAVYGKYSLFKLASIQFEKLNNPVNGWGSRIIQEARSDTASSSAGLRGEQREMVLVSPEHGLNVKLSGGIRFLIDGESGSGKTSFIRSLLSLDGPNKLNTRRTDVRLIGSDSAVVGYVPQKVNVEWMRWVAIDNDTFKCTYPTSYKLMSIIAQPSDGNVFISRPRLRTLSGGEQKIYFLAWLMTFSLNLLVLDELDSGLDDARAEAVMRTIFACDVPIVYVTHREHLKDMSNLRLKL